MEKHLEQPKKRFALRPGDTIGIVAPASPFNREAFSKGVTILREMGFKPEIPDEIFKCNGYLAGLDQERADILVRFLTDPNVKGIVCARGGFGTMKLLPLLDFEFLRSFPKVVIGFSDITALLANLVDKCRWVAFHGPTVTTLGTADAESRECFRRVITGRMPLVYTARQGRVIFPGRASGPLMAGNLTTLCHLVGTPYLPDLRGTILLIEDRGEVPYRIDRMLTQMDLAGVFDDLAGLALGTFSECGLDVEIEKIVTNLFKKRQIPVLSGFEVGHEHRNFTLPLGLETILDTENRTLVVDSNPQ